MYLTQKFTTGFMISTLYHGITNEQELHKVLFERFTEKQ